jgi:hypothetical protein
VRVEDEPVDLPPSLLTGYEVALASAPGATPARVPGGTTVWYVAGA